MILINIVSKSENQAIEIVDFLIENKLILDAVIFEKVSTRERCENGTVQSLRKILIMGKTKALLFKVIDKRIREKYDHDMPVLFSVPILDMDWEQADRLVNETAKV
jgi:hypothetical protein